MPERRLPDRFVTSRNGRRWSQNPADSQWGSVDRRATGHLLRVPTDELKATAIQKLIGCQVDAIFGNSIHDLAMLEIAPHPFAVNPNPDLEKIARARGWTVYQPQPG